MAMSLRIRKLIGAFALFALVIIWSLLAMALAQFMLPSTTGLVAVIYYVVMGLGWVLPAMPLIRWMSRPSVA
jgi:hypothetical protein